MLPTFRKPAVGAAALVLMALLAYLPALDNGYIWDDDDYVTANPALRDLHGLADIWLTRGATPQYYPITFTSFWLEYRLWGLQPVGYHLVNVLLHAGCAVLLWRLLRRLRLPGAWAIAAVFAVHPVHVESVAWITERKNVLSGFLALLALLAYTRFQPFHATEPGEAAHESTHEPATDRRWGAWALALVLFVLALLSKTVVATLPCVVLLLLWYRRGRLRRADLAPLLPFFLVGVALGLHTAWVEARLVGADALPFELTPAQRVLLAGRALWFYAGKLLWPADLTFIYPRWNLDVGAAWQWAFPAAALAVMIGLWLGRRRLGRGPATAVFYFAGTLFPALGFFDVYPFRFSFVADHFNYLPSVGLIALAVETVRRLLAAPFVPRPSPAIALRSIALAGALAGLAFLTFSQTRIYQNQYTLWTDTLRKNPDATIAWNNIGLTHVERGEHRRAIDAYRRGLETEPDPAMRVTLLNNLGAAYRKAGELDKAERIYRSVLELDPDYAGARVNLASVLVESDPAGPEAVTQLLRAIDQMSEVYQRRIETGRVIRPRNRAQLADAHYLLGMVRLHQEREPDAARQFRTAISIDPENVGAHYELGLALARQGSFDAAAEHLRQTVRLDPDHPRARRFLAMLWLRQGRMPQAIAALEAQIDAVPDSPDTIDAMVTLAEIRATHPVAQLRDGPQAVRLAQRAVERADRPTAYLLDTLAAACAETGDFDRAVTAAEKALALARESGNRHQVDRIQRKIELYRQSRPYRRGMDG